MCLQDIFLKVATWAGFIVLPDTFKNFRGLCYIIQFKSIATTKMEFFVTTNG